MGEHTDKAQKATEKTTQALETQIDGAHAQDNPAWDITEKAGLNSASAIDPKSFTPTSVARLQRTIGNQAVLKLIGRGNQKTLQRDEASTAPPQRSVGDTSDTLTINSAPSQVVQRVVDEATIAWANSLNAPIERIQDAVTAAVNRLNTDANTAIEHIRECQTQYTHFDRMYESAVVDFIRGVEAAQEREEALREDVAFVATSVLEVAAPRVHVVYEALETALETIQRIGSMITLITPAATPTSTSPGMAAVRHDDRINWNELLSTLITTFETTLSNNDMLNRASSSCIEIVRFLHSVTSGSYEGENARTDPIGVRAEQMVNHIADTLQSFAAIGAGNLSSPAERLKNTIIERLENVTPTSLEQDIAIRWMGGLQRGELDEIDLADAYLSQLGVFDHGDNRLGHNTGVWTSHFDEQLLHGRARWESIAMELIGSTADWLGNPYMPDTDTDTPIHQGYVRDNWNREWAARIPHGGPAEAGGTVRFVSYRVDHDSYSEFDMPHDMGETLRGEVIFTVRPIGRLGGGAPDIGPVLNPG